MQARKARNELRKKNTMQAREARDAGKARNKLRDRNAMQAREARDAGARGAQ